MAKKTLTILFIVLALSVVALFFVSGKKPLKTEAATTPEGETDTVSNGTGTGNTGNVNTPTAIEQAAADAVRLARAQMLLKQFNNGTYPKAVFLQEITANEVKADTFGALTTTGYKKIFRKTTYVRERAFLNGTTKRGYLLVVDSVDKRIYSINPHIITLSA